MTLYKKEGRRYIPVGEEYDRSLPHGYYLVVSEPGAVRWKPIEDPGFPEFGIAMMIAKEAMAESMVEMLYSGKAWAINEVVEKGIKTLEEESKRRRPRAL
jgi:hypothetical protein